MRAWVGRKEGNGTRNLVCLLWFLIKKKQQKIKHGPNVFTLQLHFYVLKVLSWLREKACRVFLPPFSLHTVFICRLFSLPQSVTLWPPPSFPDWRYNPTEFSSVWFKPKAVFQSRCCCSSARWSCEHSHRLMFLMLAIIALPLVDPNYGNTKLDDERESVCLLALYWRSNSEWALAKVPDQHDFIQDVKCSFTEDIRLHWLDSGSQTVRSRSSQEGPEVKLLSLSPVPHEMNHGWLSVLRLCSQSDEGWVPDNGIAAPLILPFAESPSPHITRATTRLCFHTLIATISLVVLSHLTLWCGFQVLHFSAADEIASLHPNVVLFCCLNQIVQV